MEGGRAREGDGNKREGGRGKERAIKGRVGKGKERKGRGKERAYIKRKFMVSKFKLFQFEIVNPSYIHCKDSIEVETAENIKPIISV